MGLPCFEVSPQCDGITICEEQFLICVADFLIASTSPAFERLSDLDLLYTLVNTVLFTPGNWNHGIRIYETDCVYLSKLFKNNLMLINPNTMGCQTIGGSSSLGHPKCK
jgi:hypothetical protein